MEIEKVKRYYNKVAFYRKDWRKKHQIWTVIDTIKWNYLKSVVPKKGKILDAGSGTGRWAVPLAKRGCEVFLVDISENMLSLAKENIKKNKVEKRVHLYKNDIRELPFPSNFFDFVLCEGDVIGITPQPNKVLMELSRVLKRKRKILVNFNNYYSFLLLSLQRGLKEYNSFKRTKTIKMDGLEIRTYTPIQIINMLKKAGIKFVDVFGEIVFTDFLFDKTQYKELLNKQLVKEIIALESKLGHDKKFSWFGAHLLVVGEKE